ncbi:MAG: OFA family MFS transporter, partial [Deltaproteobacteria bacterium]|nr:OFA family MFS transporter [Deltaproteobacteria bacterium]
MEPQHLTDGRYRWILIIAAFVIMMIISIYQYSWFLFAFALKKQFSWTLSAIGLTFTVFTYSATFIQPFSGYIADCYGPRKVAFTASILVGIGLLLCSTATTPLVLYIFYGLGGIGVGILYGISAACAIKWFPDRRGLATGLVVFGFGAGTAIFNIFIQRLLETKGLQTTWVYLGILMLLFLIPLCLLYKYPDQNPASSKNTNPGAEAVSADYKPLEMLKTYQWYLIYFSFTFTVSIVLMFGAQMKMVAREFNLPSGYFKVLLVLFPLGNGLSRVVAGFISDKIGREKTMVVFYTLLGLSILCFVTFAHIHLLFVVIVFIAALLGGAPFALYPATIGDYYGARYSTTNYGITYTAKAFAGLISGWLSGYLVMQFGSYRLPLIFV